MSIHLPSGRSIAAIVSGSLNVVRTSVIRGDVVCKSRETGRSQPVTGSALVCLRLGDRVVIADYARQLPVAAFELPDHDKLCLSNALVFMAGMLKAMHIIDIHTQISIYRHLSMAKTDSLQGSLDLLVLKILSRRPRLHGYAIMAAIATTSGEVLRAEEGSLYPALYRMEEAGWIRAEWIKKDTGRRARVYELTAAGKKQLGVEESRWQSVSLAINRVLREV